VSKFEITPYQSVGEISFDMPREAVRKLFGQFKEFKKNKFSKNTVDDFGYFHVYYDQDNKITAVEFFPGIQLEYKEKNLFAMDYREFVQFIKSNSFTLREIDSGIIINDIGISLYVPGKTEIESILVYRRGYYDFLNGDS
jgi:hypothetical protein